MWEKELQLAATVVYDLISEMPYHHFCHMLSTGHIVPPCYSVGGDCTRVWMPGDWGHWRSTIQLPTQPVTLLTPAWWSKQLFNSGEYLPGSSQKDVLRAMCALIQVSMNTPPFSGLGNWDKKWLSNHYAVLCFRMQEVFFKDSFSSSPPHFDNFSFGNRNPWTNSIDRPAISPAFPDQR